MTSANVEILIHLTPGASSDKTIDALYREVKEELGLTITPEETELLLSLTRTYDFVDIYLVKKEIDLNDIVMQPEEVDEVKWVSINEFKNLLKENKIPSSIGFYSNFVLELIQRRIDNDWN